jgi:hypothetical protein
VIPASQAKKLVEAMCSGPETGMSVLLRPTSSRVLNRGLRGWHISAEPSPKAPLACASDGSSFWILGAEDAACFVESWS